MSYPAENTGPSPVITTQRASSCANVSASVSRISWSRAPRFDGFAILSRTTWSAGSSRLSLPDASSCVPVLLKDHQRVALRDRLTLRAGDLCDGSFVLGLDGHLHLHRFEDDEGVALGDLLADLALDLPDRPCDVSFDVGHGAEDTHAGRPPAFASRRRRTAVTRLGETGTFS